MNLNNHIVNSIKYSLIAVLLLVVIGFSNVKHSSKLISDVVVNIDNQFENYFIDQSDVYDLIHETGKSYLLNLDIDNLELRKIEKQIEAHRFINDAEVYLNLDGQLTIDVTQNRPLARILNPEGDDHYISTTGDILPVSSHYTARVPLLSFARGTGFSNENINNTPEGAALFSLLRITDSDEFWKAQIASISVNKSYELTLYPQVTKQLIRFGRAVDNEQKLRKLKVFYKEILPSKGWNTYTEVNLNFKNQIVCK